jgi:hypothetical protein
MFINKPKLNYYALIILFICSLFNYAFLVTWLYSVEWKDDKWRMNWEGCATFNLRYYIDIYLQELRKSTKNHNQNSRSPDQVYSNYTRVYIYSRAEHNYNNYNFYLLAVLNQQYINR